MDNYKNNTILSPFLKWAGGKRQLLAEIRKYIPIEYDNYFEPFVGAGAVFLDLKPRQGVVNDINSELINTYNVIKTSPNELILLLGNMKTDEESFYEIRDMDRSANYASESDIFKAARMIYLNRLCFNGLYRVNKKGYFNVPYGKYKNPKIINKDLIFSLSSYFNSSNIKFLNKSFEHAVVSATKDDFIYFDPPYDPINMSSSFTSYTKDSFDKNEHIKLKYLFETLSNKGIRSLLSNSNTPFIRELYKDFHIVEVHAKRNINSVSTKRGNIKELLILNYPL